VLSGAIFLFNVVKDSIAGAGRGTVDGGSAEDAAAEGTSPAQHKRTPFWLTTTWGERSTTSRNHKAQSRGFVLRAPTRSWRVLAREPDWYRRFWGLLEKGRTAPRVDSFMSNKR
jgi:hypothetical protein